MGRRLVLVLLLVTIVAGVAQAGRSGINEEPTTLRPSICFSCHASGNGPALSEMYLILAPHDTLLPLGEPTPFRVEVQNVWVAELYDHLGGLGLAGSPGVGFSSGLDDRETFYDASVPAASPDATTGPRSVRIDVPVAAGASAIRFELTATQETAPLAADLILQVWVPERDRGKTPSFTVDDAGPEGPERFSMEGASTIKDQGAGAWTVGVLVPSGLEAQQVQNALEQPFRLRVVEEFRATDEAVRFVGSDTLLPSRETDSGARAILEWDLVLTEAATGPGTVNVQVDTTAHYQHTQSDPDFWRYTKTITLNTVPVPEQDAVRITGSLPRPPDLKDTFPWDRIGEVVGYASSFLIAASIYTGGMFGKASRRQLNNVFGTAKRRVAFHNFLSYGILLAAVAHTVLFLFVDDGFHWTRGLIWGGVAILAMIGLGVTGAVQVPMIRKWNYAVWRWSHFYLAIGTMLFTVVHTLLDGQNFSDLQTAVGWSDPLG